MAHNKNHHYVPQFNTKSISFSLKNNYIFVIVTIYMKLCNCNSVFVAKRFF